jgi:hypothetical protein
MAEDVFVEMGKSISEFKDLDYDAIGESGVLINASKSIKQETT